jgi:hypothetical protein
MLTVFVAGSWNWNSSLVSTALIFAFQERPTSSREGPKVRELCLPPEGPTGSRRRHGDPCPQGHRSLRGASLGSAVPGSYCRTLSVGNQASEARVGLVFAHTTLERVGPDRVSERRNPRPNAGRSQRNAHGLEF